MADVLKEPRLAGMDAETAGWDKRDLLFKLVREALPAQTTAHWMKAFEENSIWAAPVYGYADLVADPQIAHNGTFVEYDHPTEGRVKTPGFPIKFSKTPSTVERGAPLVGQHSHEILKAAGYADDEIARMHADGAIGEGPGE